MPGDVTIKPSDTPINVTIQHGSRQVQPTDPVQAGEKAPSGAVINGGHEADLNKDVSRVIKVTKPDGTVTTETQTAHLTRTATVDTVSGQVTYGPWTIGHWDTYDVPAVPGYTPSQAQVPGQDVDSNTVSQTVNISYLAKARGQQGQGANGAGYVSAGQAAANEMANGTANGQNARAKQGQLPQTGNQHSVVAALGLGLLGLLGLYDGRRKQD